MIVLLILVGWVIFIAASIGFGVLVGAVIKRHQPGAPGPWLTGGLGCLAGGLLGACLLVVAGGAYLTGVGLVQRDEALAGVTAGPVTSRVTPLPDVATAPVADGTQALSANLLPAERPVLDRMQTAPHYTLDVAVDWANATLAGSEQVVYTNMEAVALGQVVFRLYPNAPYFQEGALHVGSVTVDGSPARAALEEDDTVLAVDLPAPLPPGAQVALTLDFTVTVPHRADRFGVSGDVMALGQWYPVLSVYDDEGWHTDPYVSIGDAFYSEASLYTLTLTIPQGFMAAVSGVETGRMQLDDGRSVVTYHSSAMREVAVALSPAFTIASAMVDGTMITSYYLAGHEEAGQRALDVAARSVQVYNDLFGGYPYADLDVVETYFLVEGSPGGMEYPGLVLISSEFYDPGSSLAQSDEPEVVWAHEVAHQWWYGVIGNDQVDDPWLDEALSTYSSILYFEAATGERAANRQLLWQCTLPYRAIQAAGGDRPVGTSLPAFDEDELAYSAIVYSKGGLFFEKLRELLGNDRFLAMLRSYYAAHRFGIVQPSDFEQAMLAAAGADKQAEAERLYQDWVVGGGD